MDTHPQAHSKKEHETETNQRTAKEDWHPRSFTALGFRLIHAL
jgi:hypothetical protein